MTQLELDDAVQAALDYCGGWAIEPDEHRESFVKMIRAALEAAEQQRRIADGLE